MVESTSYQPLIRYGQQSLSKYVVLDIFSMAFYLSKATTCFDLLNRNFHAFA